MRDVLREARDEVGTIRREDAPSGELRVRISQPEAIAGPRWTRVRELSTPVDRADRRGRATLDVRGEGDTVIVTLSERAAGDRRPHVQHIGGDRAPAASTTGRTARADDPSRQGADRILIQVPGIGSAQELKDLVGTTVRA